MVCPSSRPEASPWGSPSRWRPWLPWWREPAWSSRSWPARPWPRTSRVPPWPQTSPAPPWSPTSPASPWCDFAACLVADFAGVALAAVFVAAFGAVALGRRLGRRLGRDFAGAALVVADFAGAAFAAVFVAAFDAVASVAVFVAAVFAVFAVALAGVAFAVLAAVLAAVLHGRPSPESPWRSWRRPWPELAFAGVAFAGFVDEALAGADAARFPAAFAGGGLGHGLAAGAGRRPGGGSRGGPCRGRRPTRPARGGGLSGCHGVPAPSGVSELEDGRGEDKPRTPPLQTRLTARNTTVSAACRRPLPGERPRDLDIRPRGEVDGETSRPHRPTGTVSGARPGRRPGRSPRRSRRRSRGARRRCCRARRAGPGGTT